MKARACFAILLALLLTAAPVRANDEDDIRKTLGPDVQTCKVDGTWAMADVGEIEHVQLFLLRHYKGQWLKITTDGGTITRGTLVAIGMPHEIASRFGLGETPPKLIKSLAHAMSTAGVHHRNFNIVTLEDGYYAQTTNDSHVDGYQIWKYVKDKWSRFFSIEPNLTQTALDALFEKKGISRFLQFRLLTGHWTDV